MKTNKENDFWTFLYFLFNPLSANDKITRHEGSEIRGSFLSLITIDSFKMKKNGGHFFERELNFLSNGVLDFKFG